MQVLKHKFFWQDYELHWNNEYLPASILDKIYLAIIFISQHTSNKFSSSVLQQHPI